MAPIGYRQFELFTADGMRLHAVEHRVRFATGSVLLVHGLGEHSGRYAHVIDILNRSGLNVVRFDHRGHGHSTGIRGHVASYDDYLDDLDLLLAHLREQLQMDRVVLYGHSMGGGLVANWCLRRLQGPAAGQVVGAVLSSPWFRLASPPPWWKLRLVRHLSGVFPCLGIPTGIRGRDVCRDLKARERYETDPLRHRQITLSTAWECFLAGRWALEHAHLFPLPLLAVHGTSDIITSPQATEEFCRAVPRAHFVPLENFIHEPHHDPKWREVIYHLTEWIVSRYHFALAA